MVNTKNDNVELECLFYRNIAEMGRFSLDMEEKRGQEIILQAGQMLNAISLFSAGVLMSTPIFIEYTPIMLSRLLIVISTVGIMILVSLLLAIIAQWRHKSEFMLTAEEIKKVLENEKESYQYQGQYDYQWIVQISSIHCSKRKSNNKRVLCLRISMISFLFSIITVVMGILLANLL